MAARLWASGAVPTKRAACEAVGLSGGYLSLLRMNPDINRITSEVDSMIQDETISLSRVIAKVSRKAVKTLNDLIDHENPHIALKAASDVLDRNAETSKTLKATVTTFSMDSNDAKALAAALVQGAKVHEQFTDLAAGDFVKVELDNHAEENKDLPRGHALRESEEEANGTPTSRGNATESGPKASEAQGKGA